MKRKKTLPTLTKAEEEIMQLIWELQPCLVRDILERLADPEIPHSTVSSVVRILERKGFVGHKAYGKTHEYFALIGKDEYASQGVQGLVEKYFGGSAKELLSFLVKKENLSLSELNKLYKNIQNDSQ